MRIAYTFRSSSRADEEGAEPPEIISSFTASLQRLGHEVELVDVAGSLANAVARLECLKPEVVFNRAQGRPGPGQYTFLPVLFEQLGLAHTGEDALHLGPKPPEALDAAVAELVTAAKARHKVAKPRNGKLRVGLIYNLKRQKAKPTGEQDADAEFDAPETVNAIAEAIASFGHEVVPIEVTPGMLSVVAGAQLDVAFNIAEGTRGRGRESLVPALLDLLDVPYSGSDPATLAITLDKALAKQVVAQAGVPTAAFFVMTKANQKLPPELRFPLILKPVAEGSSKGIQEKSVVHDEAELRRLAGLLIDKYAQPVLVEQFLTGREFTVGLLGNGRPRVLPPMEIVFQDPNNKTPIYTFAHKQAFNDEVRYDVPAKLEPALAKEIERVSRLAFAALGCRDVARIDLRMDSAGRVCFIECNPLPGLTPDWSDLCLIGKAAGMDYRALIGEILAPAIKRRRDRLRRQQVAATN